VSEIPQAGIFALGTASHALGSELPGLAPGS
jgi:hypothetical protein